MARMNDRKTTLVRQLAAGFAARCRAEQRAAMSPADRATARQQAAAVAAYTAQAFGDRCAWCGLPQNRAQKDHFPPLVLNRMWTGYIEEVTVPSCASDNRQYPHWESHLDACWRSPDRDLLTLHRDALRHLWQVHQPLPRALYEREFGALRDGLDRVLEEADSRIAAFAASVAAISDTQNGSAQAAVTEVCAEPEKEVASEELEVGGRGDGIAGAGG